MSSFINYFSAFRTHCTVVKILAGHSGSAEMEGNLFGVILSSASLSQKCVTRWTTVSKAARSSGNISPQVIYIYQLTICEINAVPIRKKNGITCLLVSLWLYSFSLSVVSAIDVVLPFSSKISYFFLDQRC